MNNNRNTSSLSSGMDRDKHPVSLKEGEYSFALNANIENNDGNIFIMQNEPSNILCKKFTDNEGLFWVVGYKSDLSENCVYFFLSYENGNSKIVRLNNSIFSLLLSDIEKEDEDGYYNELSEPLESRPDRYEESCGNFILMMEDCGYDGIKGCLGFDVNTPVYDIVLKNEKCGKRMYWSQSGQPPRYLDFDKLADGYYQRKKEILCGDDDPDDNYTCLNCDKLRMFPLIGIPEIVPEIIQTGGSLLEGIYEFMIAYCDYQGNEISEYYSITNPIHIFDKNNRIVINNAPRTTPFGIRLTVNHLDEWTSFYKVAVICRIGENFINEVFIEGIHPVSDKYVLFNDMTYDSSNTSINSMTSIGRTSLSHLFAIRPKYKYADGMFTSGKKLFLYGLEVEPEWNLQPIANLLGGFMKWQTGISMEDLYEDGVNVANYSGYMRNEVYPLGLNLLCRSGYRPATLPLVGRPATEDEMALMPVTSANYKSINDRSENCSAIGRDRVWQFLNTAGEGELSPGSSAEECDNTYTQTEEKSCRGDLATLDGKDADGNYIDIELVLDSEDPWLGVESYINENPEVLCDNLSPLAQEMCDVLKGNCPDGVDCTDCSSDGSELFFGSCDTPIHLPDRDVVSLDYFNGLYQEFVYKDISEYEPLEMTDSFTKTELTDKKDVIFDGVDYSTIGEWMCPSENPWGDITHDKVVDLILDPIKLFMVFSCSIGCSKNSPYSVPKYNGSLASLMFSRYTGVYDLTTFSGPILENYSSLVESGKSTDLTGLVDTNVDTQYTDNWIKITDARTGGIGFTPIGDINVRLVSTYSNESYQKFTQHVHKDARWIKIDRPTEWKTDPNGLNADGSKKAYILELVGTGSYSNNDVDLSTAKRMRVCFWKKDKKTLYKNLFVSGNPVQSLIVNDVTNSIMVELNNDSFFNGTSYEDSIYMTVDTPVVYTCYYNTDVRATDNGDCAKRNFGKSFFTSILPKSIGVTLRDLEPTSIKFHFDSVQFSKRKTFQASCTYCVPDIDKCKVYPYKFGEFAFWQSERTYPANKELYNTYEMLGDVNLTESKLRDLGFDSEDIELLTKYKYIENDKIAESTNLCQQPIRHFKFPDNIKAPFMEDQEILEFSESRIFPLGITIKKSVVEAFLNLAVEAGLISQEQRDDVYGFEIVHGNRALSKSVIATGIGFDMFNYTNSRGNVVHFPNFPYNDLNDNIYIYSDSSRKTFIRHPFNQSGNNKFTFHSPDTSFYRPNLPTECMIEGYQYGKSSGSFQAVDDHPKWVILGEAAYNWAAAFATIESLANYALKVGTLAAQVGAGTYVFVGLSSGTSIFGQMSQGYFWASFAAELANQAFTWGKYRYEWLNIFINNGQLRNFAYYYASHGYYNFFKVNTDEESLLRGLSKAKYLNKGKYNTVESSMGDSGLLMVNNLQREESVLLSFGRNRDHMINYTGTYSSIDGSRPDDDCSYNQSDAAEDNTDSIIENIASPYIKLMNYVPSQYGDIDSVKWLDTGNYIYFDEPETYPQIYGGDIIISRFSLKRKFPFFYNTAMRLGNMVPFAYNNYKNVGFPTYYVNFDTKEDTATQGSGIFPTRKSYYNINCDQGGFYKKGRFYTSMQSWPQFLVESEINCNERTTIPGIEYDFYPHNGDYVELTQERNVPIKLNNYFKINPVFTTLRTMTGFNRKLPNIYQRSFYDCRALVPNGVARSLSDTSENDISDPWLVFKALDYYEFATDSGKLIDMKGIESELVLARFEDQVSVYNSIDVMRERLASPELGNPNMFQQRVIEYNKTELGYTGTQSKEMVSCEYGHFWVDVKRGQVFMVSPNGSNLKELTTGIRNWIKEHLPFKILKYDITDTVRGESMTYEHVSNKFSGLGISMGWDSRSRRVLLTKKDYIPKLNPVYYLYREGKFFYNETGTPVEIKLTDETYFEDVSWTIGYSLYREQWISYYSYKPDFYIAYQDYFQTGMNFNSVEDKRGLWTHPLTNQSFQVFYGELFPFTVEFSVQENYTHKMISDVSYWLEARRYQNEIDFAVNRLLGFNKAIVYNNTNNSGLLNLVVENINDMRQKVLYPMYGVDYTSILQTEVYYQFSFNHFFNRVRKDINNIPIWIKDRNDIDRVLNPKAMNYVNSWADRFRGDWALCRVSNDVESRYKYLIKWFEISNKIGR